MRTPKAIDAVIFDWGGTLTPWHTVDPFDAWLAASGDDELAKRLHDAERAAWITSTDEHRSATLADVYAAAGIEPTDEMLAAFHEWWEPHTYLDPDAAKVFAGLHQRDIRIGVLSNTMWPRSEHDRIFERDEVLALIHGTVYTSEIPWTKPHPEAFRAALSAVGVHDPARAVFVGDRLFDDIHGAKAVGMKAVLVPHSDVPPEQHRSVDTEPDAVIDRLIDLLAVIDGWNEPGG
jgi:putative hydrolase of the HAD superfamily